MVSIKKTISRQNEATLNVYTPNDRQSGCTKFSNKLTMTMSYNVEIQTLIQVHVFIYTHLLEGGLMNPSFKRKTTCISVIPSLCNCGVICVFCVVVFETLF